MGCAEGRLGTNTMPRMAAATKEGAHALPAATVHELDAVADMIERVGWKRVDLTSDRNPWS